MIHRNRTDACLSDFALDRRLGGEHREEEEALARQHLALCSRCERRWAALQADRDAFARDAPVVDFRRRRARARPRAWLIAAVGAAAAGAAILLLAPRENGTRLKGGGVRFGFYVSHAGSVRLGAPGETVAPGDALRFTYASAEAQYVAVISVDGARRVSTYYPDPAASRAAPRIDSRVEVALPLSTVLDDVLGEEHVYGVACPRPFDVEALRESVERAPERAVVVPGCSVQAMTLRKEARSRP